MMIMIVMIVMMKQKIHCLMLACVTNVTLRRGGDTKAWDREKEAEVEGKGREASLRWKLLRNRLDLESGPLFVELSSTILELK